MNRSLAYLLLVGLICTRASLAESSPPAGRDIPENFLGVDTIGVVRIDVERVDAPALRDWAIKSLRDGRVGAEAVQDFAEQIRGPVTQTENWCQNFKRAGATKLYIVARQPFLLKLPFVVVPLGKGVDAQAVAAQLEASQIIHAGDAHAPSTQPADEHERQLVAEAARARTFRATRIGNVVVYGNELTLDELRSGGPSTKSSAAANALAGAGQSAAGVQVFLLPDAVRLMREMLQEDETKPKDPVEKAILKLEWASLDLDVGKRPSASLRLHCQPGSERLVKDAFEGALKSVEPDTRWSGMLKSMHVVAADKEVDLQLRSEELARLLVTTFNQPSTAPATQSAKH